MYSFVVDLGLINAYVVYKFFFVYCKQSGKPMSYSSFVQAVYEEGFTSLGYNIKLRSKAGKHCEVNDSDLIDMTSGTSVNNHADVKTCTGVDPCRIRDVGYTTRHTNCAW